MLFDAHYHAFQAFGGIQERGLYDNMKTAVDKIGRGKQRDVNRRFTAMVSHYLYAAEFCNPASSWEKGQIEKNVLVSSRRIWQGAPMFKQMVALNVWLKQRCVELWQELPNPQDKPRTVFDYWTADKEHLMTMPAAFDGFVEVNKRVSSTCLISHEHNRYSVPASFANRPVSLHIYADRLVIVAEAQVIASHERVFTRDHEAGSGKKVYDWRHTCPCSSASQGRSVVERRSMTCPIVSRNCNISGSSFPLVTGRWPTYWRECEALVEQSSKQHVLNCLSRLCESQKPKSSAPPPTLKLVIEPVADTDLYDRLRRIGQ